MFACEIKLRNRRVDCLLISPPWLLTGLTTMSSDPPSPATGSGVASTSTARPRRSAVGVDYSQFLKPAPLDLDDSSSDSSNSDDEEAGEEGEAGGAGTKGTSQKLKGKGKARARARKADSPASQADETDVSEYEDERDGAKKDKGKRKEGAASDDDDEEESDDEEGDSSETQETPSEATESEQDLGSGTNSPPRHRQNKKPPVAVLRTASSLATPAPGNGIKVAPRKSTAVPFAGAPSTRAQAPPIRVPLPPLSSIYPAYEPPHRWLMSTGKKESVGEMTISERAKIEVDLRYEISNAWTHCDLGPERSLLGDVGWWKGKWNVGEEGAEGEQVGMRTRWGGWYPEIETAAEKVELVSDEFVCPLWSYSLFHFS